MRMRVVGFALVTVAIASTAVVGRPQNEGIVWLEDYQEARRQARDTGKPIFIEFRCEP